MKRFEETTATKFWIQDSRTTKCDRKTSRLLADCLASITKYLFDVLMVEENCRQEEKESEVHRKCI